MNEERHYAFFQNRACEFFPCHKGADAENFNCLFCYCPLYALGRKCGGNFRYTRTNGRIMTRSRGGFRRSWS